MIRPLIFSLHENTRGKAITECDYHGGEIPIITSIETYKLYTIFLEPQSGGKTQHSETANAASLNLLNPAWNNMLLVYIYFCSNFEQWDKASARLSISLNEATILKRKF